MAADKIKIARALLAVSDKTALVELAQALVRHGVEIISTGGTRTALQAAAVRVIAVEQFTGFPEILGGRVNTLQPKIHGGILARRGDPGDQRQMDEHHLAPIDLVVVNFYPFERTVTSRNIALE